MNTNPDSKKERAQPPRLEAIATAICLTLGLLGYSLSWLPEIPGVISFSVFIAACIAGGIRPTLNALDSLRRGELNVDLLMIIAAVGTALIGQIEEGVVLLFLFSLSGTLEAFAMYRTSRSIESLVQLRPNEATLIQTDPPHESVVPIEALKIGDIVRVRPGERFPVDGVVVEGESWADESTLTGESERIRKSVDSTVFAGTINGQGTVLVRMTRAVEDTTIERIVEMVQNAQAQKTPTQRLVESWQQPYVIAVLVGAALVFCGNYFLLSPTLTGSETKFSDAFYHAMVLLVAASPCAVVVSSPSVMLSAIARAGRHGVLFKGAVHLESLGHVDVIAFDKTGTVTKGKPAVVRVWTPPGTNSGRIVELAAIVEKYSEHPLGQPIIDEATRLGLLKSPTRITDFHSHTGLGVHARVNSEWVGIGREGLFTSHDMEIPADLAAEVAKIREEGQTGLLIITDQPNLYGLIAVADELRPEAPATLEKLKRLGVKRLVILTGDHERVAKAIGSRLGVTEVRAGLLPDQKVVELRKLSSGNETVAMVGDGVNDAPALATAQVGIAMGGAGTDVAIEVADVVLMRDDLRPLPTAVSISRIARKRVRQNLSFAFAMIAILVLGTFFNLPLWLGVLGHEGSTVIVVFNGLRLLWERLPE